MSSIRLFILGALDIEGPMHGHQLRQLAEKEHIDMWTDISVGGLYGAIRRLAAEELIDELRVEREGSYPERQVWDITATGREALRTLRQQGLSEVVWRNDPFDLAIARFDLDEADELPAVLQARLTRLRGMLAETEAHTEFIARYLSVGERHVMKHKSDRLRAEIAWHEELVQKLPEIVSDERSRKDPT
ncbi:MAG TPA: helix-turn-helix transcriptional regulator [Pseudolysinimonas sp.]|nr:helix-turn-helix transcriptional regulator [Pseudolysinimonas sp.]